MHTNLLSTLTLLAAAASKTTATTVAKAAVKSPTSGLLIYIIPLLLVAYLVILRPQRKRQQAQRQGQSAIVEGDTVATIGGIVGKVISIDSERAIIEVAPDMEMEFLRQAIARKVEPLVPVDLEDTASDDGDEDGSADDDEERGWHGYHPDDVDHDSEGDPDHPDHPAGPAGHAGPVEADSHEGATKAIANGSVVPVEHDPADLGSAFGVPAGAADPVERTGE